jgi:hypothetical protein
MKIVNNLYFLLNQHNDLVLWDTQLNPKHKFRLEAKVNKLLANENHVYILFENGTLDRYNLESGEIQKSKIEY